MRSQSSTFEQGDRMDVKDVEEQLKKLEARRLIEEEAAQLGTVCIFSVYAGYTELTLLHLS